MWIFRNDAFVSIVEDRSWPDALWVRARVRGDIERFFKGTDAAVDVVQTDDADYRFRACVSREMVAAAVALTVAGIDYPNFKGSIAQGRAGDRRHDWYMKVWSAGMAEQRAERVRDAKNARRKGKKKGAQS